MAKVTCRCLADRMVELGLVTRQRADAAEVGFPEVAHPVGHQVAVGVYRSRNHRSPSEIDDLIRGIVRSRAERENATVSREELGGRYSRGRGGQEAAISEKSAAHGKTFTNREGHPRASPK